MLKTLQQKPLATALFITLLYALWFLIPILLRTTDSNTSEGIESALEMGSSELITALILASFISLLGWWKIIGFTRIEKGGIKFLTPLAADDPACALGFSFFVFQSTIQLNQTMPEEIPITSGLLALRSSHLFTVSLSIGDGVKQTS